MIRTASPLFAILAAIAALTYGPLASSQTSIYEGDWPYYHGGEFSQRYSPLDQIDAGNVNELEIAWRFSTQGIGPDAVYNNPSTPLEINGILYANVGSTRNVLALDATSGQILWLYRYQEGDRFDEAPRKGSGRGVAYWTDGDKERVIDVSPGYNMVSLDAKTGIPDPDFGDNGTVDLFVGVRNGDDPRFPYPDIGLSAPPFVMNDVIVVGAAHRTGGRPRAKLNTKGDIRGFDVRTGERLWTFHTIPERGEVGYETWLDEGVEFTGNSGVWAPISGDPELGHVYLPIEDPTGDYYGGDRPGANLFSSGLVALDVQTGERQWHFQFIHHDIWDWDVPAAPVLIDLPNGRDVVMSVTKQAFVYAFDPTYRRACLADSGAPGTLWRRARRVVCAHPALSHPTGALRYTGLYRRQSDRLHAGTQSSGPGSRCRFSTQPQSVFTPFAGGCARWHPWPPGPAILYRRRQLGGLGH